MTRLSGWRSGAWRWAGMVLAGSLGWGALGAVGCAAAPAKPAAEAPKPADAPLTADLPATPADPKAGLTLGQITPVPKLPASRPTAGKPAPLDAVQWFAQAHAALSRGQRQTAIGLLEKAVALDPDSADLQEELGNAYGGQDKALAAYARALELRPDNLHLRQRIGRQYLLKNKLDEALLQFRLAAQTTGYAEDNEAAAVVDFFLGRTLQRTGYDRAALDQYLKLVKRLESAGSYRGNRELASLLQQPEIIYGAVAELYEKHGRWPEAVTAYRLAAERQPEAFEYPSKLAGALAAAGRDKEATELAAALVGRFRASPESLKLLREVYAKLGRPGQELDALRKLHEAKPDDRIMLFALADALTNASRSAEAERLLADAYRRHPGDADVIRRRFDLYDKRGDLEGAVRLLVRALADHPDSLRDLSPMWAELLKPSRGKRVRLPLLQKLAVEPDAEAARLFWVSRVAEIWNRDALSRGALEQGAALAPPFPPVYRALFDDFWGRPDWDEKQKADRSKELADKVRAQGNAALAAELEGLSLLRQKKSVAAADKLDEAAKLGAKSPDFQLTRASAQLQAGERARAESLLWKLVSDHPTYEDGYAALFRVHLDANQPAKASEVLRKWRNADPDNVNGRILQAQLMQFAGMTAGAEAELNALFARQPENPSVLAAMFQFYAGARRLDEYIGKLEEVRKKHPDNREAVEQLVEIYYQNKRLPDALRVLDAARDAVIKDPDLLYYVAHLYGRIDQKETEEKLLGEVIKLDPANGPASNDLGYTWADAGKNLGRAEELIRVGVAAEPDNQSFLDSLGWVLYKRGKFAEALEQFEKAIGPANRPDPVVLDHMGDVLYRLGRKEQAAATWKRASKRLDEVRSDRDDLKKLRLTLTQKLEQAEQGRTVNVAPIVETPPEPPAQAKKDGDSRQ